MVERRSHAPTIIDVAEQAGVSRATASRALSGYGRTSAATVERVRRAADEIGYRPNELARAMRAGSTGTIGLVVIADFTNAFFDRATKSIVDAARKRGYQVLISNTDEDPEVERGAIETLLEKQVDGLIVFPSATGHSEHLEAGNLGGRPLVLADRRLDDLGVTTVTTDDFTGTREAVRNAVSLGHSRLGFLITAANIAGQTTARPPALISSVRDRADGFAAGAADAGIPPEDQVWHFSEDVPESSEAAVAEMLDLASPPTVIFTSNNDMALSVLKVAGSRGLAIGREVSLVTVDDSPWAAYMVPGITVVARPVEQLGELAVERLVAEIESPGQPVEDIQLPTELIPRASVADLRSPAAGR
ncbi:LacI family DNA-binding transcriptional regulator [Cryobacterium sp. GrIS_2_6]|uniref:LacI family DNA-binding transcriptional regulator n=1 Tax=Cryobacterium sp. GrIS_2_6 TaxID=3162785 RepID=UPI002DFF5891|nr:LacI family transcriptional regulator [Cryobacterium psychrotolerans]